jgi:glycosyltransferase involved in cell wall biosynthesis
MVKNEEGVLERMINSVKDIVDEFIIVDTGSTDTTKDIIAKYGKVYEIPFVNYVDTKNECLKLATGEYILYMDADEVLYQGKEVIKEWVEGGNVEALVCKITEGSHEDYNQNALQYDRIRLWRNNNKWKFEGPGVHEVCVGPGPTVMDGRILVRHDHTDKNPESHSKEKYEMWERLLRTALDKNPQDARALFYLGRTLVDLNRPLEAVLEYTQYLDIPDNQFIDERWQAAYDLGKIYKQLGEFDKAIYYFDQAEGIDPRRREHLNEKAYIAFIKQDFEEAVRIYSQAKERPIPSVSLFLDPTEYQMRTIDQLFLSTWNAKHYKEAESIALEESNMFKYDQRILNNLWWCRTKTNMVVFLTLGNTPEPVWGGMIDATGVGGVETTYIELGRTLAALGHDVYLFCNTEKYHEFGDVKYIPYFDYTDYTGLNPDVTITSRWFESFNSVSGKKILWLQDANPLEANYNFGAVDKVIVSSQWHKDYLITLMGHRIPKEKLEIIPLGIDKRLFTGNIKRDPLHVAYSSNPNRGLDILADMWPRLEKEIPGIHLSVLYGWQGLSTWSAEDAWKKDVYEHEQAIYKKLAGHDVKFLGRVTKKQVADTLMSAALLVYPCNFYETFCLTGLEAQAAGSVVVTSDMGALHTTVNEMGNVLLQGSPLSTVYQKEFITEVKRLLENQKQLILLSDYNSNFVKRLPCDWNDIALLWQHLIWGI